MKKQYTVHHSGAHSSISRYVDGEFIDKKTYWCKEAMYDEIEELQEKGFTLAFSPEEISIAKQNYEYMLSNQLIKKENQYGEKYNSNKY